MPDVSFYILPSQSQQERHLFACKLIEKAYRNACFCYVLTDSAAQSQQVDDLLWTFRAGSFIPHQIYTDVEPDFENIILIGSATPPPAWQKTVINLSSECPHDLESIERILEILDASEETKELGRNRYRHYQKAGIEIATHKMDNI